MYMNVETGEMSEICGRRMVEVEPCAFCGEWVEAEMHRTQRDQIFCNLECLQSFYYYAPPFDEGFISFI